MRMQLEAISLHISADFNIQTQTLAGTSVTTPQTQTVTTEVYYEPGSPLGHTDTSQYREFSIKTRDSILYINGSITKWDLNYAMGGFPILTLEIACDDLWQEPLNPQTPEVDHAQAIEEIYRNAQAPIKDYSLLKTTTEFTEDLL